MSKPVSHPFPPSWSPQSQGSSWAMSFPGSRHLDISVHPLPPEHQAPSILGAHGHPSKAGVPPARMFCHLSCPPPSLTPGGPAELGPSLDLGHREACCDLTGISGWASPRPPSPATSTACSSRRPADRSGPILAPEGQTRRRPHCCGPGFGEQPPSSQDASVG